MAKTKRTKAKRAIKAPAPGEDFGRRLQEARTRSGLSQRELADRLNSNVTTISRYESTGVLPSVAMAAQLAQAVGASLDQLTGLAQADHELVELARKLATALGDAHREALAAQLRAWLELAGTK